MSIMSKLPLFALTALMASATTLDFPGPTLPVIGDPLVFKIFDVKLTQPTISNPLWVLQIFTNYGATIPGSPNVIPPFPYNGPGGTLVSYTMSDMLIVDNKGVDYGVIMAPHDGYGAGSLYSANSFQTSQDVMNAGYLAALGLTQCPPTNQNCGGSPRPEQPVLLGTGGTLKGAGTLTGAKTGDGVNTAMFTVTAQFSAPADFLSVGDFQIIMSSYVCANGVLIGMGNFNQVPEPSAFFLTATPLLLLLFRRRLIRGRLQDGNDHL